MQSIAARLSPEKWLWTIAGITGFLAVWTLASARIGNPVLLPDPAAVVSGSSACWTTEHCGPTCAPA